MSKMVIKLRSVNIESDYEQLKTDMSKTSIEPLTNDQVIRELVDWYRHSKLDK